MKTIQFFFTILKIFTFFIGISIWLLMYPYLYIRYKTTKEPSKRLTRHPNITMIFIYKVINDLFKNYILK